LAPVWQRSTTDWRLFSLSLFSPRSARCTDEIEGETETKLLEFRKDKQKEGFEVFITRPSGVTPKDRGVLKSIAAAIVPMIKVDELAAAMLDIAVNGSDQQTLENHDLVVKGRKVLDAEREG
jgi:hypothetical protein